MRSGHRLMSLQRHLGIGADMDMADRLASETTVAFILTFKKGFDNFYANVGHLSVARADD
jgi:hypothetical protein